MLAKIICLLLFSFNWYRQPTHFHCLFIINIYIVSVLFKNLLNYISTSVFTFTNYIYIFPIAVLICNFLVFQILFNFLLVCEGLIVHFIFDIVLNSKIYKSTMNAVFNDRRIFLSEHRSKIVVCISIIHHF